MMQGFGRVIDTHVIHKTSAKNCCTSHYQPTKRITKKESDNGSFWFQDTKCPTIRKDAFKLKLRSGLKYGELQWQ